MSYASGAVQFPDGLVLHCPYNGSTDVVVSHLYDTRAEMWEVWRDTEWLDCTCGQDEPVRVMCTYGGGSHWPGRACRHCRAVTDGRRPYEIEDGEWLDGQPAWSPYEAIIDVAETRLIPDLS